MDRRSLHAIVVVALAVAACGGEPGPTPLIQPGAPEAPREVNLIMRDFSFVPTTLDLVPGETIVLNVVNGGLVVHEAVFGNARTQAAWEQAEAATVGAPPGPTPVVVVPPELAGLRVVVESGQTTSLRWTVPADAPEDPDGFLIGCHIPGHFARGMVAGIRWIGPDGRPLAAPEAGAPAVPSPPPAP